MFLALLGFLQSQTETVKKTDAAWKFGERIKQPGILGVDSRLRTMVGQDHTTIRAPFGGNENWIKTVADPTMMKTQDYSRNYQLNNKNLRVYTEDPRLNDGNSFIIGEGNKFNPQPHVPESFSKINDFCIKRRNQRDQWRTS